LAALAWAITPIFLSDAVYALADPPACLFVTIALWLAVVAAQNPQRRFWCVWSVCAGLLAALFKYPVVVATVPGGLVALYLLFRSPRTAIRYLIFQGVLVLAVAAFLVFVYGATTSKSLSANTAQLSHISSFLRFQPTWANVILTISPLNLSVFVIVIT